MNNYLFYPAFLYICFWGLVVYASLDCPWLCLVPHLQSILLVIHGDHRRGSKLVDHGIPTRPTLGRLGETNWKHLETIVSIGHSRSICSSSGAHVPPSSQLVPELDQTVAIPAMAAFNFLLHSGCLNCLGSRHASRCKCLRYAGVVLFYRDPNHDISPWASLSLPQVKYAATSSVLLSQWGQEKSINASKLAPWVSMQMISHRLNMSRWNDREPSKPGPNCWAARTGNTSLQLPYRQNGPLRVVRWVLHSQLYNSLKAVPKYLALGHSLAT